MVKSWLYITCDDNDYPLILYVMAASLGLSDELQLISEKTSQLVNRNL